MNLDGLRPWAGLAGGTPADVTVAGIAYDGSAVYRRGAAQAPQRIRQLSAAMPPVTEEGHLLAGVRDYDPEELEFIKRNGVLLVSAAEISRDLHAAARKIADRLAGSKVHVSFDIDVLDPAFAPGTEIPSSGGLTSRQAIELLRG